LRLDLSKGRHNVGVNSRRLLAGSIATLWFLTRCVLPLFIVAALPLLVARGGIANYALSFAFLALLGPSLFITVVRVRARVQARRHWLTGLSRR
jgi:hypothetical protein